MNSQKTTPACLDMPGGVAMVKFSRGCWKQFCTVFGVMGLSANHLYCRRWDRILRGLQYQVLTDYDARVVRAVGRSLTRKAEVWRFLDDGQSIRPCKD